FRQKWKKTGKGTLRIPSAPAEESARFSGRRGPADPQIHTPPWKNSQFRILTAAMPPAAIFRYISCSFLSSLNVFFIKWYRSAKTCSLSSSCRISWRIVPYRLQRTVPYPSARSDCTVSDTFLPPPIQGSADPPVSNTGKPGFWHLLLRYASFISPNNVRYPSTVNRNPHRGDSSYSFAT